MLNKNWYIMSDFCTEQNSKYHHMQHRIKHESWITKKWNSIFLKNIVQNKLGFGIIKMN